MVRIQDPCCATITAAYYRTQRNITSYEVVTTPIRVRLSLICSMTALRPFEDLHIRPYGVIDIRLLLLLLNSHVDFSRSRRQVVINGEATI